jgi:phosphoglycerol transferase MdoB-like AlkP superfamily enzyme
MSKRRISFQDPRHQGGDEGIKLLLKKAARLTLMTMILMGCHRLLAFKYLASQLDTTKISPLTTYMIGVLSDIWIAGAGTLLYLMTTLAGFLILKISRALRAAPLAAASSTRSIINRSAAGWFAFIALTTVSHQAYVEFFGHQIIPFHLTYLTDLIFIRANAVSILSSRSLALTAVAVLLFFGLFSVRPDPNRRPFFPLLKVVVILIGATTAHAANLHYKVQRFIPSELSVNFFEKIYYQLQYPSHPPLPPLQDFAALTRRLGIAPSPALAMEEQLEKLYEASNLTPTLPLAGAIKGAFEMRRQQQRKPLVLILLLESLRPEDIGFFHPAASAPTLTPRIDQLAAESVTFMHAYSTSNVTRGGQEAAFCGHLSGVGTSMMRERPDIQLACLPQLLPHAFTFWLHGGRGEFDSQEQFWRRHGVDLVLTQSEFAADTPKTGWGVSDRALMQKSLPVLTRIHDETRPDAFSLGMILTVSNHIPWSVPEDCPDELGPLLREIKDRHPSFQSTAYMDSAVGLLIDGLKQQQLWQDTILIAASDHGAALPAYYPQPDDGWLTAHEESLGHIFLAVGGGIVEEALNQMKPQQPGQRGVKITDYTSAASIAPFIHFLARDTEKKAARFFMPPLFSAPGRMPVMVNFGTSVYFPADKVLFTKDEIMGRIPVPLSEERLLLMTYVRTVFNLLDRPRPKPAKSSLSGS